MLRSGEIFHPATPILAWLLLTLVLAALSPSGLLLAIPCLLLLAAWASTTQSIRLLMRARWIMVAILLVYAYATPGRALWSPLGMLSPTLEGLFDGGIQVLRLAGALIALSLLLARVSQARLIAGLYVLARPLGLLGISRERMVIRLALTLQYAEEAMQQTMGNWKRILGNMLEIPEGINGVVVVDRAGFGWRDAVVLLLCLAAWVWMWR